MCVYMRVSKVVKCTRQWTYPKAAQFVGQGKKENNLEEEEEEEEERSDNYTLTLLLLPKVIIYSSHTRTLALSATIVKLTYSSQYLDVY